jgi:hypothetical protein
MASGAPASGPISRLPRSICTRSATLRRKRLPGKLARGFVCRFPHGFQPPAVGGEVLQRLGKTLDIARRNDVTVDAVGDEVLDSGRVDTMAGFPTPIPSATANENESSSDGST